MSTTKEISTTSPIGRDTPRVDGPRKVSGQAQYTSDFHFPGTLYAVPVGATIANGRVETLDTAAAEKMPGVRAIFHRENIGKIFRSTLGPAFEGICEERRPPFEDDVIRYYGQYVALAVADTFETAKAAADAVRVTYAKEKPNVDTDLKADDEPDAVMTTFGPRNRLDSERGDVETAFASAPVKLDETYVTPAETHNPIELHATTAIWDGSNANAVRVVAGSRQSAGRARADVRSAEGERARHHEVCRFRFRRQIVSVDALSARGGCGAAAWQAGEAGGEPQDDVPDRRSSSADPAARAARGDARRQARLAPARLCLHTSMLDAHHEDCGEATAFHYSVPNLRVTFGRAKRNIGATADMRGPGAVPGLYATESAMNELADQLKIDPVKLRILNEPKIDEGDGPAVFVAAFAGVLGGRLGKVRLVEANAGSRLDEARRPDARLGHGDVRVDCRTLPRRGERAAARRRHGPRGLRARRTSAPGRTRSSRNSRRRRPVCRSTKSRSSWAIRRCPRGRSPAVRWRPARSCRPCFRRPITRSASLLKIATTTPGSPFRKSQVGRAGVSRWQSVCESGRSGRRGAVCRFAEPRERASRHGQRKVGGDVRRSEAKILDAFLWMPFCGSHLATGDRSAARQPRGNASSMPDESSIRWLVAIKFEGAVVMGIGMALFEHTAYDPQNGAPINSNLADYIVTVNADVPPIDVHFLDYPDKEINEVGARGIGEIGLAGIAAAITAAVHHATGVRVRELPVRIEDLLV